MHSVQQTSCGKYAVVSPTGEEVVKFQYEWLAVSMAEELNRGRVMVRGCVTVSGYASHSISAFVAARLIRKLVQGDFTTHRKSQPQKEAA